MAIDDLSTVQIRFIWLKPRSHSAELKGDIHIRNNCIKYYVLCTEKVSIERIEKKKFLTAF